MKSPSSSVSFIASAFFVPSNFAQWASLIRAAAADGGMMKAASLGRSASGRNSGLAAVGIGRDLRGKTGRKPARSVTSPERERGDTTKPVARAPGW